MKISQQAILTPLEAFGKKSIVIIHILAKLIVLTDSCTEFKIFSTFSVLSSHLTVASFLIHSPSGNNPLTTSRNTLVITVDVPQDVPITSVRLPDQTNVESFTVTVRRPNTQTVPVNNGEVRYSISSIANTHIHFCKANCFMLTDFVSLSTQVKSGNDICL